MFPFIMCQCISDCYLMEKTYSRVYVHDSLQGLWFMDHINPNSVLHELEQLMSYCSLMNQLHHNAKMDKGTRSQEALPQTLP